MEDSYGYKDKIARCSFCNKFMPWSESNLVEKSDGRVEPSPVLVEFGFCIKVRITHCEF